MKAIRICLAIIDQNIVLSASLSLSSEYCLIRFLCGFLTSYQEASIFDFNVIHYYIVLWLSPSELTNYDGHRIVAVIGRPAGFEFRSISMQQLSQFNSWSISYEDFDFLEFLGLKYSGSVQKISNP